MSKPAELEVKPRPAPVPWLTLGCALVPVLAFGVQLRFASPLPEVPLVLLGGNAPLLVRAGELDRLATATLLHAGILHLAVNAISLMLIGAYLEGVLGRARLAVLLLASALGGSLASALLGRFALSVGASTAVSGLVGALFFLLLRRRDELPSGLRLPAAVASVLAAGTLVLGSGTPVDRIAHLGGLLCGVAVTALAVGGQPLRGLLGRGGGAWTAAALVLALVFTSGVGRSAVRFASGERASLYRWLDASMVAPDVSPIAANNRADWLAFDPDAPDTSLRLAREQIAELVGEHPGVAGFLDTLALLHYRLGEFEPAIDAQRAALDLAESGLLAARLAQLEARHLSQSGVLRQGRGSQLEITPRARDGEGPITRRIPSKKKRSR